MNFRDVCGGKAIGNICARQNVVPGMGGKLDSFFLKVFFSGSYRKMMVMEYQKKSLGDWFISPSRQLFYGLALSNWMPKSGLCMCIVDAGIKTG